MVLILLAVVVNASMVFCLCSSADSLALVTHCATVPVAGGGGVGLVPPSLPLLLQLANKKVLRVKTPNIPADLTQFFDIIHFLLRFISFFFEVHL
jgi:hypothetical protein